jgi:hypothetical protein
MTVYLVLYDDRPREGPHTYSVWTTADGAQAEADRLNSAEPSVNFRHYVVRPVEADTRSNTAI